MKNLEYKITYNKFKLVDIPKGYQFIECSNNEGLFKTFVARDMNFYELKKLVQDNPSNLILELVFSSKGILKINVLSST